MKDLRLRLLKLFVGHRTVGRSEIDGALDDLSNSPTRANRLIVDLNLRKLTMIFVEPLRINRVRESCACSIDKDLIRRRSLSSSPLTIGAADAKEPKDTDGNNFLHSSSLRLFTVCGEAITNSMNCLNVSRLLRRGFDFFANSADVNVDAAWGNGSIVAPDTIE